jgi:protein-disulfide isomerase
MTEKLTKEGSTRSVSQTLTDIRNGAIILACLAVAFHFSFQSVQQAPTQEKPAIEVGNVEAALTQKTIVPAQLPATPTSGYAVATSDINTALQARTNEIRASQPVIQKTIALAQQQLRDQQANANTQSQAVEQPVAPINQPASQKQPLKLGLRADGSSMTELEKAEQIKKLLAALPESFTVNWPAENKKVDLYVFSDPTCGYCKKLHQALPILNQAGISVHYFMYPRDMPHSTATTLSATAQNLNNIWCSVDQRAAFDEAFQGYKVRATNCADLPADLQRPASPLLDHYFLGTLFDVRGTPTMATSTGLRIEGFSTAQELINKILPR